MSSEEAKTAGGHLGKVGGREGGSQEQSSSKDNAYLYYSSLPSFQIQLLATKHFSLIGMLEMKESHFKCF